ncbi:MAG: hypothetical protein IT379_25160, partial [Deltaproteobacteria bacterium]|nr:hypothetical protein [Deltaproteobacteria bacterium]
MGTRRNAWLLFAVLVGACGDEAPPPPERLSSPLASVDESRIRASIADDDIELAVPLRLVRSSGALEGRLRIEVVDVRGDEPRVLGTGSVAVSQTAVESTHRVRIDGAGDGLVRAETAPVVVHWRFEIDGDDLFGRRSLFAALGNLEVQLRGPTELPADGTSPFRVIVRDPRTQATLEGAHVVAMLSRPGETSDDPAIETPLFEGDTDARGELLEPITLPDGIDAGDVRVTVTHDDATVWTTRAVRRRTDGRLYLGTDKTLYKPGQDIHLRLLALDGADRTPVADRAVVFEGRDGRGNKVFRRRARTDAFGVAATVLPTDHRVNEGEWRITAEVEGRTAEVRVPVRR